MGMVVQWKNSGAITRKLQAIRASADMSGRHANRVMGDIKRIALEDNVDKLLNRGLLEGVDRHGKALARMADSTYRDPRRGFGPVLAPEGMNSRFIKNLQATWENSRLGRVLVMRYVGIVDAKGRSFAQYHLEGCRPGSNAKRPNWSLPRRDVAGVTPKGLAAIQARTRQFLKDAMKGRS